MSFNPRCTQKHKTHLLFLIYLILKISCISIFSDFVFLYLLYLMTLNSRNQTVLYSIKCGGSKRPYDFHISFLSPNDREDQETENQITFAFSKTSRIHFFQSVPYVCFQCWLQFLIEFKFKNKKFACIIIIIIIVIIIVIIWFDLKKKKFQRSILHFPFHGKHTNSITLLSKKSFLTWLNIEILKEFSKYIFCYVIWSKDHFCSGSCFYFATTSEDTTVKIFRCILLSHIFLLICILHSIHNKKTKTITHTF